MIDVSQLPPPAPKVHLSDHELRATAGDGRSQYDVERMRAYLKDGTILRRIERTEFDPLDQQPLGDPDLVSDGTFVLHAHLAELVGKHAPRLPDEFVASAAERGYEPRDLTEPEIDRLLAGEHTRGVMYAQHIAAQREPRPRRGFGFNRDR